MKMNVILTIILSAALSSCSTYHEKPDIYESESYRSRQVLKKSIIDGVNLTEAESQKILNSKIQFSKKMKLAVLRLNSNISTNDYFYRQSNYNLSKANIDNSFVDLFYKKLEQIKNISSVIAVPPSLTPENANINQLRSIAIRMQAHLMLVIASSSDIDTTVKVYRLSSYAKCMTTAESYLIDTATGVILTTGIYSDEAEVERESKEYSIQETIKKAKLESEKKIFANIANDTSVFLEKVK